jgi:hypothetical protein
VTIAEATPTGFVTTAGGTVTVEVTGEEEEALLVTFFFDGDTRLAGIGRARALQPLFHAGHVPAGGQDQAIVGLRPTLTLSRPNSLELPWM